MSTLSYGIENGQILGETDLQEWKCCIVQVNYYSHSAELLKVCLIYSCFLSVRNLVFWYNEEATFLQRSVIYEISRIGRSIPPSYHCKL